jgi:hypothetical protein
MNFDLAADKLHREEFSRLAYAVTPRPEELRAMTVDALRDEIAAMRERLGHSVINSLAAPEIVTIKGERKFITIYANPSAPDATRSGAVCQLRDRVVAASAERGFYASVRGFTAEAQQFAEHRPSSIDRRQSRRESSILGDGADARRVAPRIFNRAGIDM